MAKIGIKNIADALARKKNLSPDEAEKYVETFFSLINEALIPDKIVKIKGFGTFKLVDVRDRESVDVNTGERVVIDGHSKISFVPDNTLKELVNKPFSQFETVVLNDGVDFEKENISEGNEIGNDNVEISDEIEKLPISPVKPQKTETEQSVPTVDEDTDIDRQSKVEVSNETPETDKVEDEKNDGDVEPVTVGPYTPVSTDDTIEPLEDIELSSDTGSISMPVGENLSDSTEGDSMPASSEEEQANVSENGRVFNNQNILRKVVFLVSVVAIMLIIFCGGYYLGSSKQNKVEPNVGKQEKIHVAVNHKPLPKSPTKTTPVSEIVDSTTTLGEKERNVKAEQPEEKTEKHEVAVDGKTNLTELENASRLVNTGAYVIEGLSERVKMKKGQTLSGISKFYLGEGMECYIIVYNKKTEFAEGEIVNIPKLKLKKKASNKKVS